MSGSFSSHSGASFEDLPHCQDRRFEMPTDTPLTSIPFFTCTLSLAQPTHEAIQQFEETPSLPGILLIEQGHLVGVLSRRRFYEVMSRPFSLELFTRRPLRNLWKTIALEPLIVEATALVSAVTTQALQRHPQCLLEPIVLQLAESEYRLIDVHTLLLAQNLIHEETVRELQENKKALLAEKELAQITLKSIVDGVITTNDRGEIQELNPVAETLTGWSRAEALGQSIEVVFQLLDDTTHHPLPHPTLLTLADRSPVYSTKPALLVHQHPQQRQVWDVQYSASPIFSQEGALLGSILVFRDVTQQQNLLRKIHWQARHDPLTGLINRAEFEDKLTDVVNSARRQGSGQCHTLVFLDLDRFKAVNDTCGHQAGDELLRQVSEVMKSCLREADFLARLGGDEFAVLLLECDLPAGRQIADRIYQAIQNFRFFWENSVFSIGVSMGLTVIRGDRSAADVLQQADSACYLAKNQGRNQIQVFDELTKMADLASPVKLVNAITDALAQSRFMLFYQKIYGAIAPEQPSLAGAEVLLRLVRAPEDILPPDAFMQTAERHNLMTEIDHWVIRQFCQHYASLCHQAGTDQFILNLSGASLNQEHFISFIRHEVRAANIAPEKVCFEILETLAIANLTRAQSQLQSLKNEGFRLALGNFGAGMSSFHYLQSLPIDYLKISGSLIGAMLEDRIACEMVAAIIRIGHAMGLKIIAERVETEAILKKLHALHVDYIQGFLVHTPETFTLEADQSVS